MHTVLGKLYAPIDALGRIAARDGHRALLVGGVVRDALLQLRGATGPTSVRDADVVIVGPALAVAEALRDAFGGTLESNPRFLTASWHHVDYGTIDLATARSESYAHPAALPDVKATRELTLDLKRRDFTLNAVAAALDAELTVHDPFDGQGALQRRELDVLHAQSFVDDPSRLLRGARLACRLNLRWSKRSEALAASSAATAALMRLSPARLGAELALALREPDPPRVFDELGRLGQLGALGLTNAGRERLLAAQPLVSRLVQTSAPWLDPKPSAQRIFALLLAFELADDTALHAALKQTGLIGASQRPHRQALIAAARTSASALDRIEFAIAMTKLLPQERAALWVKLCCGPQAPLAERWAQSDWAIQSAVTAKSLAARGIAPSPAMAQALLAGLRSALAGESAEAQHRAALGALHAPLQPPGHLPSASS